ncbi:MAG: DNA-directed RNA polymerase subunit alpha C-terminal domain-containing protein [Neglectibacter sp.]
MEKRPLDTELEVLWSEHLEDDVFSVRAYNVLAHRLGLRTLGDILNLTRDDIAKARGAGKKTLDDIAKLVRSCGYELNGFTDAGPDCKSANRGISCAGASALSQIGKEFNRSYHHPKDRAFVFPNRISGETGWDIVKRAIFATYNVSSIASLPDGAQAKINEFAMGLTDILFQQLRDRAKEYKRSNI